MPLDRSRSVHAPRGAKSRQLRVIGGQWRGRKFRFPVGATRPTPDRVRETLFNWLQGRVEGAHCLDLYAGSGSLGLEALSRGAASVTFVEQQRAAAAALEELLRDWQASGWRVRCEQAQQFLVHRRRDPLPRFDLVFLDPPFDSGELPGALAGLDQGLLAEGSRVYVEHARALALPPLPAGWDELRAANAGEVRYHLFTPAAGS